MYIPIEVFWGIGMAYFLIGGIIGGLIGLRLDKLGYSTYAATMVSNSIAVCWLPCLLILGIWVAIKIKVV